MKNLDLARIERLAGNEAQNLNENFDSKGFLEQLSANSHAVRLLAQNIDGREHAEEVQVAYNTMHNGGGLEAEEWYETLDDFKRLFKI